MPGAGEQRVGVLEKRRHDELVARAEEKVEDRAAQLLDAHGLRGQDVLDVFRKQPLHGDRTTRIYARAQRRSNSPTIIEDSPTKRICPSDICVIRRNVSRQRLGARKGSTPSRMSMRASARRNVVPMRHFRCAGGLPTESRK